MKKLSVLASLVLFCATFAPHVAVGMEKPEKKVYVQNNLTSLIGANWRKYPERIRITEKGSWFLANEPVAIEPGKMKELGNISSIKKIEVEQIPGFESIEGTALQVALKQYPSTQKVQEVTRIVQGVTQKVEEAQRVLGAYFVDISGKFFEFLGSPNYKGNDVVISFDWADFFSRSTAWKINFKNKE